MAKVGSAIERLKNYRVNISPECRRTVFAAGIVCCNRQEINEYLRFLCINFTNKIAFIRDWADETYAELLESKKKLSWRDGSTANTTIVMAEFDSPSMYPLNGRGQTFIPMDIIGGLNFEAISGRVSQGSIPWVHNLILYSDFKDKYIIGSNMLG